MGIAQMNNQSIEKTVCKIFKIFISRERIVLINQNSYREKILKI